jgi:hypothetical protein
VQRLKDKVGEVSRARSGAWVEIQARLNRTLQGWEYHFCHGTLRKSYRAIDAQVRTCVRGFLQRRHKVPSRGTAQFSHACIFGELGVHQLSRVQRGGPP